MAGGMLTVWNDVDPGFEDRYEAWYQADHLRDRLRVPGFISARRHRRVLGEGREFFTFYSVETLEVLSSPAYIQRLFNLTDETRVVMPHFRRLVRAPCGVLLDVGDGAGGFVGTLVLERCGPHDVIRNSVSAAMEALIQNPRITRGRLLQANYKENTVINEEDKLRPDPSLKLELAILIEGTDATAVSKALSALGDLPAIAGAHRVVPPSTYQMIFASRD